MRRKIVWIRNTAIYTPVNSAYLKGYRYERYTILQWSIYVYLIYRVTS